MKATIQALLRIFKLMPDNKTEEYKYYLNLDSTEEHDKRSLLYRHRKQRGVNLGSWFVLERWITETPFRHALFPGQSDLDIAKGTQPKEILERHWDSWITAEDFAWLSSKGINTVRIPVSSLLCVRWSTTLMLAADKIGYYHLCALDSSILQHTDFHGLDFVFQGAWPRIVKAVETAQQFGIGVLFDLHAAPGKQNRDSHSGTSSPTASLFRNPFNLRLTTGVLRVLVSNLHSLRHHHDPQLLNVVGVEILNEPSPPSHTSLQEWYGTTIRELRSLDPGLPILISDCWAPDAYTGFVEALPQLASPICLDHHLYRCFTSTDISTPVSQHIASLAPTAPTPQTFARVKTKLEDAGGALVVGEWSAALNPGSLQGQGCEQYELSRFVGAQLDLFERHCAGWFFWTYKKEHPNDVGWSFRDAVDAGVFPSRVGLFTTKPISHDGSEWEKRQEASHDNSIGRHSSYWAQYPGHYEHWRFGDGFVALTELCITDVSCPFAEHGYQQGIDDATAEFQTMYC
ncbi:hypothetical protein ID866_6295 [Astraeus odoratus]|nr:hypothetical protein ID866_6295 [Astraeus odoratus]